MSTAHLAARTRVALALSLVSACSGAGNDGLGQSLGGPKDASVDDDASTDVPDASAPEPDASEPTPEPDASEPTPDAGTTSLTVRVRSGPSTPLAGAIVLFHDAQGAVLGERLVTSATGQVTTDLAPAFVTVLPPQGPLGSGTQGFEAEVDLFTYANVAPADTLTVEVPLNPDYFSPDPHGQYAVALPTPLPDQLPGRSYAIQIVGPSPSCVSGSYSASELPASLLLPLGCELPASGNALIATFTDSAGSQTAYASASGLAAPPPGGTLPVTLGRWAPPAYSTLRLTGYTGQGDGLGGRLAVLFADGRTVEGAIAYDGSFDLVGGTDFGVPEGLGEALHAEISLQGPATVGSGLVTQRSAAVGRRVPLGTPADIGYAEVLDLPHSAALSGDDPLRPTISFTPPARREGVDALIASLYIEFSDNETQSAARWAFLLPPDAEQVVVPELPADLAGLLQGNIRAGGRPRNRYAGISAVGDDVSNGFDAFRARPVRMFNAPGPATQPVRVDVSDCGLFAITSWFEPLL